MNVRIKENSWLAKLAAKKLGSTKVAIVFGRTIHLHNTSREEFLSDREWVCHELKHVEQYQQNGWAGFLVKYLYQSVKNGYHRNKFEIAARESEQETALLDKMKIS